MSDRRGHDSPAPTDHDTTPPANRSVQAAAGLLLLLPIVALMWVGSYARVEPKLGGFPFYIWYHFLWVFLCSACTYGSYRLVVKARSHRPMTSVGSPDRQAGR